MLIARVLRCLVLALAGAAAAWLIVFLSRGQPLVALLGALFIVSLHAWVLAIEFVCVRIVNRDDPAPRAGAVQLARAWAHEVWSDVVVFAWRQPFRAQRFPDRIEPSGRRGVVLVHGFLCNRGVFNPWLERLRAAGVPSIAVDLDQLFGSIDDSTPTLDAAVLRLTQATGLAPVVVAHSMGGLVVRAWLDRYHADARVHRVITIGTPHRGTWFARFAIGTNTRQMRRAGAWLHAMGTREPPARASRFTCYYSNCDNVVLPASTATLPGADNRHLPGLAHVAMIYDAAVLAEVMRWLDASSEASLGVRSGAAANAR